MIKAKYCGVEFECTPKELVRIFQMINENKSHHPPNGTSAPIYPHWKNGTISVDYNSGYVDFSGVDYLILNSQKKSFC